MAKGRGRGGGMTKELSRSSEKERGKHSETKGECSISVEGEDSRLARDEGIQRSSGVEESKVSEAAQNDKKQNNNYNVSSPDLDIIQSTISKMGNDIERRQSRGIGSNNGGESTETQEQRVVYEWKPVLCTKCRGYGHEKKVCKQPMQAVWRQNNPDTGGKMKEVVDVEVTKITTVSDEKDVKRQGTIAVNEIKVKERSQKGKGEASEPQRGATTVGKQDSYQGDTGSSQGRNRGTTMILRKQSEAVQKRGKVSEAEEPVDPGPDLI
ncbi:OLC1v1036624C1 [Oldenlandia corymbosa var. corymbosa]|uniref:OLC1v1036624C1 n=1 Tax=Oldenlandia corymbosa var. corymbosa TaxID=529605 RepID=A0AAV1CVV8_OLDCO|nr:OLC1v1036624C1 [Oldenlandia corymbosa var. corymbosa]